MARRSTSTAADRFRRRFADNDQRRCQCPRWKPRIRGRHAGGDVVTGGIMTASCGSGCWGEFSAEIPYVLDDASRPESSLCMRGRPRTGVVKHLISLPVTLEVAEWAGPPQESAVPAAERDRVRCRVGDLRHGPDRRQFRCRSPCRRGLARAWVPSWSGRSTRLTWPIRRLGHGLDLFRAPVGHLVRPRTAGRRSPRRVVTGDHSPLLPRPGGGTVGSKSSPDQHPADRRHELPRMVQRRRLR